MASVTITIPTPALTRYLTAIGYTVNILDVNGNSIPNPITPNAAFKTGLANHVKTAIKNAEAPAVQAAALNTNSADVETNIQIT